MKYPAAHLLFLLDDKGEPYQVSDVYEWAKKYPSQRLVARDLITISDDACFVVSTAFLGVKGLYDLIGKMRLECIPMHFETVVFDASGEAVDANKYDELEQALLGHERMVERWRKSLGI